MDRSAFYSDWNSSQAYPDFCSMMLVFVYTPRGRGMLNNYWVTAGVELLLMQLTPNN